MRIILLVFLFLTACGGKNPLGGTAGGNIPTDHNPYLETCEVSLKQKGYDLAHGTISGTYPQCSFSCVDQYKLSNTQKSCEASVLFDEDFDFTSLTNFDYKSDEIELKSGYIALKAANLLTEKTSSATSSEIALTEGILGPSLSSLGDKITLNGASSGEYFSVAFNGLNDQVLYNNFFFTSSLPFGKELVTTAETNYKNTVFNFSDNLKALWHLNETAYVSGAATVMDSTANGLVGFPDGNITSASGKLKTSAYFNGSSMVKVNDSPHLDGSSVLTIAFWVYPQTLDGIARAIVSKRVSTATPNNSYSLFFYTGNKISVDINGTTERFTTNTVFEVNKWYHVVMTFDGSLAQSQRVKMYVNGQLDKVADEPSTSIVDSASDFYLGTLNLADGRYFHGRLDEVAIWKKALTLSNIQEMYRRGANRLKFQVRTCTESVSRNCSGTITDWVGPDGTNSTYFTEINNFNTSLALSSSTYATPWSVTPFAGLWTWMNSYLEKYVQFKTIFESDSTVFYPDLVLAGFNSSAVRYSKSSQVSSKNTISIPFHKVDLLEVDEFCVDENSNPLTNKIKYEFSIDGASYLVFDGTSWVASSPTSTMNKSQVNSLTKENYQSLGLDSSLSVRMTLTGTGASYCEVKRVRVKGQR